MLPRNHPDRIHVAFDDHRLVANAGLLLPVTLAHHLGLGELVDRHVDLGDAPGRANPGDKLLTLVASALAGGDCIDDADVLRTGSTARVLGCAVKAPSTLGTFLRSFRWGHVRQLDRVSRELLARAGCWRRTRRRAVDHRPGLHRLRDLPVSPWLHRPAGLSPAAGRRRGQDSGPTPRGARIYAGATGQLTVRADSGFYTHAMVAVCRKRDAASPYPQSLFIEAIPADGLDADPLLDGRRR